eukprot:s669_g3.t1
MMGGSFFCKFFSIPVDPQFPPTDKTGTQNPLAGGWRVQSLYLHPDDASRWACLACGKNSPLPPQPELPKSQEEAQQQENDFIAKVKCVHCGTPAHYVVRVQYFTRPTQWLRPAEHCPGCELLYSHLPAGKDGWFGHEG